MDPKDDLHRYLRIGREALLWKLEDLNDYDVRRPLTPTGTNLLGLVKHVASVAAGYFGDCFERPFPEPLPWFEDDAEPNADMWAPEPKADIIALWERAWAHADATIGALDLDATATVPWWPAERRNPTLHLLLVHMTTETHRHAGHADILRELIDGRVGHRQRNDNLDPTDWAAHRDRLEQAATQFR